MGSGCLMIDASSNKFLLIKRSQYVSSPHTWCLPGGMVDFGESASSACARELLEETGIRCDEQDLHLIHQMHYHAPEFVFNTFALIMNNETTPSLNWESDDFVWVTIDDLPSPLHPGVEAMFNNDLAAKKLNDIIDLKKRC